MRAEELIMPFKKYKGEIVQNLILRKADYIDWLRKKSELDRFEWLYDGIAELVKKFDDTPIIDGCCGKVDGMPCQRQATRFSFYWGRTDPMCWCEECDPLQTGADRTRLYVLSDYYTALQLVGMHSKSRKAKRDVIKEMAQAKGLIQRRARRR